MSVLTAPACKCVAQGPGSSAGWGGHLPAVGSVRLEPDVYVSGLYSLTGRKARYILSYFIFNALFFLEKEIFQGF